MIEQRCGFIDGPNRVVFHFGKWNAQPIGEKEGRGVLGNETPHFEVRAVIEPRFQALGDFLEVTLCLSFAARVFLGETYSSLSARPNCT